MRGFHQEAPQQKPGEAVTWRNESHSSSDSIFLDSLIQGQTFFQGGREYLSMNLSVIRISLPYVSVRYGCTNAFANLRSCLGCTHSYDTYLLLT